MIKKKYTLFSFFYDFFLIFFLLSNIFKIFSKKKIIFLERIFWKKQFFKNLKKEGFSLEEQKSQKENFSKVVKGKKIIWVHAVSVGETKALKNLLLKLKKDLQKDIFFIVSSITKTGHNEAKKTLFFADTFIYLPFDFYNITKNIFFYIKPSLTIISETDFWYNFLRNAKENNSKIAVVNAKISKTSFKRFKKFSFFSKKIFSLIDLFLAQDENYKEKFKQLKGVKKDKVFVTGNLKTEENPIFFKKDKLNKYKTLFNLKKEDKVITIASTHKNEEELILDSLKEKKNPFKIFLAPRHPERFLKVKKLLLKKSLKFSCFQEILKNPSQKVEKIILVDKMGVLNICYSLSKVSIVGGSFVKKIGGHNILEPALYHNFVFFGPYTYSQENLKKIVLNKNVGKEISNIFSLKKEILEIFQRNDLKENFKNLEKGLLKAAERTYFYLKNII